MTVSRLSARDYWDECYRHRLAVQPVAVTGYRNFCSAKMLGVKEKVQLRDKRILEIGGGGSGWVALLAEQYPESSFVALDYSETGCRLLSDYAKQRGLHNIDVRCSDFLDHTFAVNGFDVVYSHGVVEHFSDLETVLSACAAYLAEDGRLITFIPNLSGVLGVLTRWFNRAVFDIHFPYDREGLVEGHRAAGLDVLEAGYLCSNNFSVLSSCFADRNSWRWHVYRQLARLSRLLWLFESRVFPLPAVRMFSPYIYVIARKA
jgi:2-polyprenyl-6-hydroxyphenyl methylase/3-demethylubiquinone-9 3-methyltransferase